MCMQKALAIGIVLLPPAEITALAIEANKAIATPETTYALNTTDTLPHITLLQCFIAAEELPRIKEILTDIASSVHAPSLHVNQIQKEEFDQKIFYSFGIERVQVIQLLHEEIVKRLFPYFLKEGSLQASFVLRDRETEVVQGTYDWVRDFVALHSHTAFDPHITLGIGKTEATIALPPDFHATILALCHLGNHNTCRKVLASWELQ